MFWRIPIKPLVQTAVISQEALCLAALLRTTLRARGCLSSSHSLFFGLTLKQTCECFSPVFGPVPLYSLFILCFYPSLTWTDDKWEKYQITLVTFLDFWKKIPSRAGLVLKVLQEKYQNSPEECLFCSLVTPHYLKRTNSEGTFKPCPLCIILYRT